MKENTRNKRTALTVVAVLLVLALVLGGTIAWLTSTSKLNNTFTVGEINPVNPDGTGPDGGNIPLEDKDGTNGKLNGNLYEPSWKIGSKLVPSAVIAKNPYVGVGAKSEESYIYVYVKNTMKNNDHIYFNIDTTNWEAVPEQVTKTADGAHYVGGLFKYKTTLIGSKTGNTWTATPLFQNIEVDNNAVAQDFTIGDTEEVGSIGVVAYIHQAKDEQNQDLKDVADQAAKDAIPSFSF